MNWLWDQEAPFIKVFRGHHFLYIAGMLVIFLLMVQNRRKIRENREKIRYWLLGTAVFQQILLYAWYAFETGFNISESLPLHISRISSILGIVYLITKKAKTMDVLFYFGLFAYGSFLYPQRVYTFYHVIGVSYFINHALTILLPFFSAIAYNWRPTLPALFKAYGWFLIYFFFVYFLNPLIDGNYFYLKYRPLFGQWPDYLYVPAVLIFTFLLFCIGFSVAGKLEQSEMSMEKNIKEKKLTESN